MNDRFCSFVDHRHSWDSLLNNESLSARTVTRQNTDRAQFHSLFLKKRNLLLFIQGHEINVHFFSELARRFFFFDTSEKHANDVDDIVVSGNMKISS
jgi:hypothetical protein